MCNYIMYFKKITGKIFFLKYCNELNFKFKKFYAELL